ncbi:hypothetical protein VNO77_43802 [Canavalia gladiata]|uniref:Uncharacterized protein n=1 Tax=Canavalia gladiata TaxID=3824 RepID=A0AAN9JUV9_CANGL
MLEWLVSLLPRWKHNAAAERASAKSILIRESDQHSQKRLYFLNRQYKEVAGARDYRRSRYNGLRLHSKDPGFLIAHHRSDRACWRPVVEYVSLHQLVEGMYWSSHRSCYLPVCENARETSVSL